MKTKKIILISTFVGVLTVLCFTENNYAQRPASEYQLNYWLNAGLGFGGMQGSCNTLGANIQIGNFLISVRTNGHYYSSSFVFPDLVKYFRDYFILAGFSTSDSVFHFSASVGPSLIYGKVTRYSGGIFSERKKEIENVKSIVGFTVFGDFFWKVGKNFGLGLELFADLNKSEKLNGFTLSVFLGNLY